MLSFALCLASFLPLFALRPDDPFHADSAGGDGCRSS
jgi:hypothetical protein